MFVHLPTTSAMSSSSTSSFSMTFRRVGAAAVRLLNAFLQIGNPAVLQLGSLGVIADALCRGKLVAGVFELLLQLAGAFDGALFVLPLRLETSLFFLQVGEFLLQPFEPLDRRAIAFLA
jgi:hypothetical protein